MTTKKHTPEPWQQWEDHPDVFAGAIVHNDQFRLSGGYRVADFSGAEEEEEQAKANAARAVACVNALAGIPDPAAFVEAALALACAVERNGEIDPAIAEPLDRIRLATGMHTDPEQCRAESCGCVGVSIVEFLKHRKAKR